MLRLRPARDRAEAAEAAGELDQRCGPGCVVVRAGPGAEIVPVGEKQDRAGAGARNDGDEVAQADIAEPRDRLVPGVLDRRQAVEAELLLHPRRRSVGARRPGGAIGVIPRELGREGRRGRPVERRRQRRRGEGARPRDRERQQQQRRDEEQRRAPHEARVDRLWRGATPRPAPPVRRPAARRRRVTASHRRCV